MNQEIQEESLRIDRDDLFALLEMRFGNVHPELKTEIEAIKDGNILQRLILVVANAPDFQSVLRELQNSSGAFRIVGEAFNPIAPSQIAPSPTGQSMKGLG